MAHIVIYQKPACTTCRTVYRILKESGVDFESVDYYLDRIPRRKLNELIAKMGIRAKDLLRSNETIYRKLGLGKKDLSEEALIDLMVRYPDLIQRPIVEKGARSILARPAERVKEIL